MKFISDKLERVPRKDTSKIIEYAAQKFELNPKQEEFLIKKIVDSK